MEIARLLCKYWKSLGSGINKEGGGYTDGPSYDWVQNELERLGVRTAKKNNRFGKLDQLEKKEADKDEDDAADDDDGDAGPARKKRKRGDGDDAQENDTTKPDDFPVAKPIAELPKPITTYEYEAAFETKSLGLGLVQPENTTPIVVERVKTSTAASLGVWPMDELIGINGVDVEGKALGSVAQCIAALRRRPIRVKFRRYGYLALAMDIPTMPDFMTKVIEEAERKKKAEEEAAKTSVAETMAAMASGAEEEAVATSATPDKSRNSTDAATSATPDKSQNSTEATPAIPGQNVAPTPAAPSPSPGKNPAPSFFLPPSDLKPPPGASFPTLPAGIMNPTVLKQAKQYAQLVKATMAVQDAKDLCDSAQKRLEEAEKTKKEINDNVFLVCSWATNDVIWMNAFRLYFDMLSENGTQPRGKDGGEIGQWVSQQRKIKRDLWFDRMSTKASLPKFVGRMFLLEEAGFNWEQRQYLYGKGLRWEDYLAELIEYKRLNGDCNVTGRSALARWAETQRANYKARTDNTRSNKPLTDEQVRRLDEIGFRWSKQVGTSKRTLKRRQEEKAKAEMAGEEAPREEDNDSNSEDAIVATGEQDNADMASYYYNVPGTFGSDGNLPTGSYI